MTKQLEEFMEQIKNYKEEGERLKKERNEAHIIAGEKQRQLHDWEDRGLQLKKALTDYAFNEPTTHVVIGGRLHPYDGVMIGVCK
jgi:uncharacterized coiled-coil DUF342 family protein